VQKKPAKRQHDRKGDDQDLEHGSSDALEKNHAAQNEQNVQGRAKVRLLDDKGCRHQADKKRLAQIDPPQPPLHAGHQSGPKDQHRDFCQFRGLQVEKTEVKPSLGSVNGFSDKTDPQQKKQADEKKATTRI
jgi:hypothetical protein